eukprot:XP_001694067.1 nitrite transporter [Chlamydomonas reinhardtii]
MICSNMPSALHLRCPSRARHAASRPLVRSYLRRGSGSGNGATGFVVDVPAAEPHVQTLTPAPAPAPPAAPAPAPAPAPPAPLLPPASIYTAAVAAGTLKCKIPLGKAFVLAVLAGAYLGFAGLLSFTLLNTVPGLLSTNPGLAKLLAAAVFPLGLALITICGGELFTGNTALMPAAVYEGKATWGEVLPRWAVVYLGNLLGCLAMVVAVVATGLVGSNHVLPGLAVAKTSVPLGQVLVRSVLCNWLVCLAVWMALAANNLPGKLMGMWMPVTAFVTVGLEHSIANMWVIPIGMALGAPVSAGAFLTANLIPVTLGNVFAGAVLTAGSYSLAFGRLGAAFNGEAAK